jgi:hypothetical protein
MRRFYAFLILVSLSAGASAGTTGRGGVFFGSKSLNHSDWGSLDSQGAWGINLDVKGDTWPIWVTSGYIHSQDDQTIITSASPLATTEISGETTELRLGIKKDFAPINRVRFSVAGGPAYLRAKLDSGTAPFNSDDDSTVGAWAGADLVFNLQYVLLGVSYQYSHGNVDLFGSSIDAGGSNLAFMLGFGW